MERLKLGPLPFLWGTRMNWVFIAKLVFEIVKWIMERKKGERHALFARLDEAQRCVQEDADCTKLEALHTELKERREQRR